MVRKGLDQSGLARALGVRDATVSDWFKKGSKPSGAVLMKMPDVLDVDGHWLLTGQGEMVRAPKGAKEHAFDVMARYVDRVRKSTAPPADERARPPVDKAPRTGPPRQERAG